MDYQREMHFFPEGEHIQSGQVDNTRHRAHGVYRPTHDRSSTAESVTGVLDDADGSRDSADEAVREDAKQDGRDDEKAFTLPRLSRIASCSVDDEEDSGEATNDRA